MYQIDSDPVWQAFWELWQILLVVFWLVLLSACLIYIPLKSWAIKGGRKAAVAFLDCYTQVHRNIISASDREIIPAGKGSDHVQVKTFLTVGGNTHVVTTGRWLQDTGEKWWLRGSGRTFLRDLALCGTLAMQEAMERLLGWEQDLRKRCALKNQSRPGKGGVIISTVFYQPLMWSYVAYLGILY